MSTALTVVQQAVVNLRSIVESDGYQKRFEAMLGKRAPQFIASISNVVAQSDQLARCDPRSVILSAVMAATLDLPIEKSLGYAYVVPYGNVATFQIGYKGLIQLALRSGQYASMLDANVNQEAFKGYDEVGEPMIDWTKIDETKEPIGYVFAWRTVNGFKKIVYWSKAKCLAHGKKFSKTFNSANSTWKTNTDAMCMKTVIRSALSKYGLLSIEMQTAMTHEDVPLTQGPDGVLQATAGSLDLPEGDPAPEDTRTMSQKLLDKKAADEAKAKGESKTEEKKADPAPAENKTEAPAVPPAPPADPADRAKVIEGIQNAMIDAKVTEKKLFTYAKSIPGMVHEGCAEVWEISTEQLQKLALAIPSLSTAK